MALNVHLVFASEIKGFDVFFFNFFTVNLRYFSFCTKTVMLTKVKRLCRAGHWDYVRVFSPEIGNKLS